MLPAIHRLRRSGEFTTTVKGGRRVGRSCLVLYLAEPASPASVSEPHSVGPTKVGFIVSRQVGPAVVRNRVKRRLRQLMAARVVRLSPGSRAVVRANPAAARASAAALGADLDSALNRLVPAGSARAERAGAGG